MPPCKAVAESVLSHLSGLLGNNLVIGNPTGVLNKLETLVSKGPKALQVVTDFDMTMTRFRLSDGRRGHGCHGVIGFSKRLPASYNERVGELYNHYYPKEIDPDLSREEKVTYMEEWWEKAHECTVETGLRRRDLTEIVRECDEIAFRDGVKDALDLLQSQEIPLLIFSAGIGDVLTEVLRQKLIDTTGTETSDAPTSYRTGKSVHVVSNFMTFNGADPDAQVTGFVPPTIHVFNKDESALVHSDYVHQLEGRKNVLLIGDSLGDLSMSDGIGHSERLSIGFLNDRIADRLPSYRSAYDIVLLDDQSWEPVVAVLNAVLGGGE